MLFHAENYMVQNFKPDGTMSELVVHHRQDSGLRPCPSWPNICGYYLYLIIGIIWNIHSGVLGFFLFNSSHLKT